jgi:hypothetical protein
MIVDTPLLSLTAEGNNPLSTRGENHPVLCFGRILAKVIRTVPQTIAQWRSQLILEQATP